MTNVPIASSTISVTGSISRALSRYHTIVRYGSLYLVVQTIVWINYFNSVLKAGALEVVTRLLDY